MTEGQQLLRKFSLDGSENAFKELVTRYAGFVHATALRMVAQDQHLTEDIVQAVFIRLARKAGSLPSDVQLGGWLYHQTCHLAANALRSERRRMAREKKALEMNQGIQGEAHELQRIASQIDAAMPALRQDDQKAIALRFFDGLDFREIGESLGCQEDAARMRVNRALERLRTILVHRGLTVSIGAIGTVLAGSLNAAPAGLAIRVAEAALLATATKAGITPLLFKLIPMTSFKSAMVGTVVILATAVPWYLHHRTETVLRQENDSLRAQIQELNQRVSGSSGPLLKNDSTSAISEEQHRELLKLRGEVGALKQELKKARSVSAAAPTISPSVQEETEAQMPPEQARDVAKLNDSHQLLVHMLTFAQKNEGRLPGDLEKFNVSDTGASNGAPPASSNRFELVFTGVIDSVSDPSRTLLIRELEPWKSSDGAFWRRTYGFVDGHSEIHRAPTLQALQAWEEKFLNLPQNGSGTRQ